MQFLRSVKNITIFAYAQVRIYQLENRYHFRDRLKFSTDYPILSRDLKEPSLGIKSNQERTKLHSIVYFELKFAKNLPSTLAFSESFCQKFQEFQKALRKGSFNWYKSEALIIPRKKIPERLPRST